MQGGRQAAPFWRKRMDIFESRRKRLYAQMELSGVSCLLITPSADMQYLTDLTLWADERLLAAVFTPGFVPFFDRKSAAKRGVGEQSLSGYCLLQGRG